MNEVIGTFTVKKIVVTFFRVSKPTDAVWETPYMVVIRACVMPAGYGVGYHRLFVLDFLTSSMIGKMPPRTNALVQDG